jgi:hypothetical protein
MARTPLPNFELVNGFPADLILLELPGLPSSLAVFQCRRQ